MTLAPQTVQELTLGFRRVTLMSMSAVKFMFVVGTVLGVAVTVSAQEAAPADADPAAAAATEPTGPTSYDFEDDLVTGDLVRPDGELLNVRRRGRRASLIRIREDFIPEMLKSVEKL
jgi:hypothetical protein